MAKGIMRDIFKRLPLMSMLKQFVSEMLHSTKKDQLLILDRIYWNGKICCHNLFLVGANSKEPKELIIPRVTDSDMGFKVIGSCNGLVCVTHYSFDQNSCLFLWNPDTDQTRRINESSNALLPYQVPPNCLLGFYFNHNVNDYEVVRLHSFEDTESECLDNSLGKTCAVRVEKYSLRSGLWREIECCGPLVTVDGILFWTENFVSLKGTLFWIAMEVSEKVSHEMIISFNFNHNLIGKIEFPFSFKGCSEIYKKVAVFHDSVALLICSENKCMEQCLDLWVFHDNYDGVECWTKIFTIEALSSVERPIGIWINEILMSTGKVIHSGSRIIALLQEDALGAGFSYNVFNYVESTSPL
ncbi:hypothetical protein RIF29_42119 [Crotalaria pallida]|uniref:F-box associated beta-propeller type 1 domain-containing protein n=1 Tax=Crotalaria pallida TaxID=3830 RepID=A0AAN9EBV5_CROPI